MQAPLAPRDRRQARRLRFDHELVLLTDHAIIAAVQGAFRTPQLLAAALLRGPVTPERIAKLLRHARKGTRAEFAATLAAIPEPTRAQVAAAGAARQFQG